MALHIKIKTPTDCFVHVDTLNNDYTLCGMETAGDSGIGFEKGVAMMERVDCPDCIARIKFCKGIRKSEYKDI